MIQLTIIKITEYGPWTLTLGSDREHELQMLQAHLYREIQKLFSEKNCLVFSNRFDEFFVITNGLTLADHIEIQQKLEQVSSLKLSMSIGYADNPFDANLRAYEGKKTPIVLDKDHHIFGFVNGTTDQKVTIMHFDVENITSQRKVKSPYEISSTIFGIYAKMSEFFLAKKSLAFFMGGDNFMVVTSGNAKKNAREFLEIAKKEFDVTFNCGIGTGRTAREAVKLATKSLDTIREIRDAKKEKPEIYELSCF
ncbi:GTP cyclohydrolase IIa [Candidatus Nitrosotenuis aquarius]|uniref:GTP cyclohydrolase IIa n=1 Tax=Candidatus Nitrosotenuis aquarius TaxID=1846278 RepID=UPI000C1E77AE|nr:GTP cyclohydrolase IIa [Candidatus Nitrosotenuis aquarius]